MKMTKREVDSLVDLIRRDKVSGMLATAERLGALLADQSQIDRLSEVMTGCVPADTFGRGIRAALLEIFASAAAKRLNLKRFRIK